MSFLHPAAFYGLASILALILLSLWRLRPARVVVPSVRLWERVPDRLPPVRALRRPRASLSLLLQMLVAAALVFAMAGPGVTAMKPAPRGLAVVIDLSVTMEPRMETLRQELEKLDPADDITVVLSPSLDTWRGLAELQKLRPIDRYGDPGPALDLAAGKASTVLFFGDRTPDWKPPAGVMLHLALVGGPLRNIGIVDAGFEDDKLFVRLSESAELNVSFDGSPTNLPAASFHLVKIPPETEHGGASLGPDGFSADNSISFERSFGPVDVGLEGRPDPAILSALEADGSANIVRGATTSRLLIRVGHASTGPSTASTVVAIDPPEGVESWSAPGELSVANHPLMRSVTAEDLKFIQVGKLTGPLETVLIYSGAAIPIAGIRKNGEIVLAVRYASTGWPAFPSFPIFWSNVLDYSASKAGRVNGLLDEAASRPGLERKPLDPAALGTRPLAAVRSDWTGRSIALAALLLAVLWFVETRHAGAE